MSVFLSSNYNYGPAGRYLEYDLLDDPDLVAEKPTISFETAIWFWMTRRETKPSCHEVMVGEWIPDEEDKEANRLPGYGVTTNILNGAEECGRGGPVEDITEKRVKYFNRSSIILGVSMGENLDCYNQEPFDSLAHLMKKKKEKFPRNGQLRMPVDQA
ncbi:Glycoside hydrolase [Trema orientale]|uniref:Glycoside hydrolase n=1 Tax=Trema orientale TaxID=63057 RepID=A0A2P5FLJ1_TREOI|nr:Glycoside hydrolase [Trema orientale]